MIKVVIVFVDMKCTIGGGFGLNNREVKFEDMKQDIASVSLQVTKVSGAESL